MKRVSAQTKLPPRCVYCQRTSDGYTYQQPLATVTRVEADTLALTTVGIEWGTWTATDDPLNLAPASLMAEDHPHELMLDLHRLVRADRASLEFETVGEVRALPMTGERYVYAVWWRPFITELVENPMAIWTQGSVADDHDHCGMCMATIDESTPVAYFTDDGVPREWSCADCYERFIRHGPLWARR